MSVTASKLGSSPIAMDWTNLGLTPSHAMDLDSVTLAWTKLKARFTSGEIGFYEAPIKNELSQANESGKLAQGLLEKKMFTDCLVLGIGGSSLGPLSVLQALPEKRKNNIRFHIMENPDPIDWRSTLAELDPETTLICPVTKSGTTFETMAQLLLALEWTGRSRFKSHIVAITDPTQGDLRAFATREGISTLAIAPSIGGRFSIFSPVGLFFIALSGLSVSDFVLGAKQVHDYVEKTPHEKNPLFILGHELLRTSKERPIHVCMPYSTRLKPIGPWFVQLWGESLGKNGKGFTPIAASGATDQHSILQLLRDGPDDKVTVFMTVDSVDDVVKIPKAPLASDPKNRETYPAFQILEGHTLQELLSVEQMATSRVLTKNKRPNLTFKIDRLDERSMGALYFALCVLTSFTGTLWDINPFDQPGVEEGKVYIREALSRNHDESLAKSDLDDDNSPVGRLRRDRT